MTAAAFTACYADWRLIKTRSVVQIVLEVPIEQSDLAYQVLGGMPVFGSEKQEVAVAKLNLEAKEPEPASVEPLPARARNPDKRLVSQAGIACNDPVFQRFLLEQQMVKEMSADQATTAVRLICGVLSRKELLPNTPAGNEWQELYGKFLAWKEAA